MKSILTVLTLYLLAQVGRQDWDSLTSITYIAAVISCGVYWIIERACNK
nr:MAG TPA: hypothetical protein [Bacteriophage sp.]